MNVMNLDLYFEGWADLCIVLSTEVYIYDREALSKGIHMETLIGKQKQDAVCQH